MISALLFFFVTAIIISFVVFSYKLIGVLLVNLEDEGWMTLVFILNKQYITVLLSGDSEG